MFSIYLSNLHRAINNAQNHKDIISNNTELITHVKCYALLKSCGINKKLKTPLKLINPNKYMSGGADDDVFDALNELQSTIQKHVNIETQIKSILDTIDKNSDNKNEEIKKQLKELNEWIRSYLT